MTPLHRLPRDAWAGVWGVFTDIDDTLTTAGVITDEALAALAKLDAAGVTVIPITGRPAGWSAPFALAWPVRAIVAENGAVALHRANMASDGTAALAGKDSDDQLVKTYQADPVTRAANYRRLQQVPSACCARCPAARWRGILPVARPTSPSTTANSHGLTPSKSMPWCESCAAKA